MLIIIPLLTTLIFASIYPLCFWISAHEPLRNDFHKFHIGLPNFLGGVAVVGLLFMHVPLFIKIAAVLWKALFISCSYYYWKKGAVNPRVITIPCIVGLGVFFLVLSELVMIPLALQQINFSIGVLMASSVLAGVVLCLAFYTMNLGHWYLNVHGLPMSHLKRAVYVFWFFLILRAFWDAGALLITRVFVRGEWIPLWQFVRHMDGFFLTIAFFFGTIFPIISLWFVKGTLDVKSTQSATGILYVVVSSVLIGDITYKYYLIRYGFGL